ncbi:hypothetical protein BXY51_008669 [Actinoplanes cyaneus]|nr:hypothetical protein [Actinoplanes cyaneus]
MRGLGVSSCLPSVQGFQLLLYCKQARCIAVHLLDFPYRFEVRAGCCQITEFPVGPDPRLENPDTDGYRSRQPRRPQCSGGDLNRSLPLLQVRMD